MGGYDHALRGAVVITPGTADYPVGRAFAANCTVAGDVSLRMFDGSTHVVTLAAGYALLPFAARGVNTSGTTATAVFSNLL